jgi:DNA topoisomerase-3
METAGKLVEDEELRRAMKENGIGRPSTRAVIIETLFKRHYIRKERKNLVATPTGMELIDLIHEELLKSAELTGIWEKKLRDIEAKRYDPKDFVDGLKQQVTEIVRQVICDQSNRHVAATTEEDLKQSKKTRKPSSSASATLPSSATSAKPASAGAASPAPAEATSPVGQPCPLCGKGHIIKGKTAYGCSEWKNGCTWRQPFTT